MQKLTSPLIFTFFLLAMIAGAGRVDAQVTAPDFIFTDGKVFTADSIRPWAQAVAIRGERILFVGSSAAADRLAGPHTRVIRLAGRVVPSRASSPRRG